MKKIEILNSTPCPLMTKSADKQDGEQCNVRASGEMKFHNFTGVDRWAVMTSSSVEIHSVRNIIEFFCTR